MNARRLEAGFSLVELMVALVIGMLLLAGILSLVIDSRRNHGEVTGSARLIENGRYALTLISDDVEHAGFYGEFHHAGAAPGALPNPCLTSVAALDAAMPLHVQGYQGQASPPVSCIAAADYVPNTDLLVVRRASTEVAGTLAANDVYLQSRGGEYVLDVGSNAAGFDLTQRDGTTPAAVRKFRVHVYFISPCSVPVGMNCSAEADGGRPIPTLKRLELTATAGATTFSIVPLVEGIERMRFDYGIDRSGDGSPNESSPGADNAYVSLPATTTEWQEVVAVRPYLLARQIDSSPGHTDAKRYELGLSGSVGPFSDNLRRHVFTSTVRAVNPSTRRGG